MQLQSYLDRIGYSGPIEPTLACLRAVHRCQAMTVPYEDIDVQLGVPLTIGIEAIYDKIVTRRRGGWCYELNGILCWALTEIGFDVTRVAGGVLRETVGDWAISNHLVLLVKLDRTYLADLGLGDAIREPIPLAAGTYRQGSLAFGLEYLPDCYWRFRNHGFGYPPSADFKAEPADEAALAGRCQWLQTAAESRFVQNLIVQRMEPEAVLALTGRVLRRKTADGQDKTLLNSPAELAATLEREFGISGVDAAKLWPKVAARHEELFGEKPVEQIVVAGM